MVVITLDELIGIVLGAIAILFWIVLIISSKIIDRIENKKKKKHMKGE
jgi:hypothetical protein